MAVKIRLMRIGTNRRPFYRIVAVDERKKRTGGYLELLGTYNPLTEPKEINLDQGKIDVWIKKGAVASHGFLRIIGKAPQRLPRKAKKAPKEAPAVTSVIEESPAEEKGSENSEASVTPEVNSGSESESQKSETSETVAQTDSTDSEGPSDSQEAGVLSSEKETKPKEQTQS